MKKLLLLLFILFIPCIAEANGSVSVETVRFPVALNGVMIADGRTKAEKEALIQNYREDPRTYSFVIEQNGAYSVFEKYPVLMYKDIVYIPLTYYKANMLNLDIKWDGMGISVDEGDPSVPKIFDIEASDEASEDKLTVEIVPFKMNICGKEIDNSNEEYPFLFFRNVTYMPLAWNLAVDTLGCDLIFDGNGMDIQSDSYFYTDNCGSGIVIEEDGSRVFQSVFNAVHYINGDLKIRLETKTRGLIGPLMNNLTIEKNGVKKAAEGYFGYYQNSNPLFTTDGEYIYTVHYLDPIERNPRKCRVSIESCEIEYV